MIVIIDVIFCDQTNLLHIGSISTFQTKAGYPPLQGCIIASLNDLVNPRSHF